MSRGGRKRPSAGFVMVCGTYALVGLFFFWGFQTPALHRVWVLHHELKIGQTGRLNSDDRAVLKGALGRHKRLAGALLRGETIGVISAQMDGWVETPNVTALRTPESKGVDLVTFDVQTPPDLMPFSIQVRGEGWHKKLRVEKPGVVSITMPPPPDAPEVIDIAFEGDEFESDSSVIGTRVLFGAGP